MELFVKHRILVIREIYAEKLAVCCFGEHTKYILYYSSNICCRPACMGVSFHKVLYPPSVCKYQALWQWSCVYTSWWWSISSSQIKNVFHAKKGFPLIRCSIVIYALQKFKQLYNYFVYTYNGLHVSPMQIKHITGIIVCLLSAACLIHVGRYHRSKILFSKVIYRVHYT